MMKKRRLFDLAQRFSLRKSSLGTASVLLGTVALLGTGVTVQAEDMAPVDQTTQQDCECNLDQTKESLAQEISQQEQALEQTEAALATVTGEISQTEQAISSLTANPGPSEEAIQTDLDSNQAQQANTSQMTSLATTALADLEQAQPEAQAKRDQAAQELAQLVATEQAEKAVQAENASKISELKEKIAGVEAAIAEAKSWVDANESVPVIHDLVLPDGRSYFEAVPPEAQVTDIEYRRYLYKTLEAELEDSRAYFAETGKTAVVRRTSGIYEDFFADRSRRSWAVESVRYSGAPVRVEQPYNPDYKPDLRQVSQHTVDYIKELRALNGISFENIVVTDDALAYAQFRADELNKGLIPDKKDRHSTNNLKTPGGNDRVTENLAFSTTPLRHLNDQFIHSDRELAYYLLMQWFAEYTNTKPSFGHAKNLLNLNNVALGMGAAGGDFSYTLTSLPGLSPTLADKGVFGNPDDTRVSLEEFKTSSTDGDRTRLNVNIFTKAQSFEKVSKIEYEGTSFYFAPESSTFSKVAQHIHDDKTDMIGGLPVKRAFHGELPNGTGVNARHFPITSKYAIESKLFSKVFALTDDGQWFVYTMFGNDPDDIQQIAPLIETQEVKHYWGDDIGSTLSSPAQFLPQTTFIYPVEPERFEETMTKIEQQVFQTRQIVTTMVLNAKSPTGKELNRLQEELAELESLTASTVTPAQLAAAQEALAIADKALSQLGEDKTKLRASLDQLSQQEQVLKAEEQALRQALATANQLAANLAKHQADLTGLKQEKAKLEADYQAILATLEALRTKRDLCLALANQVKEETAIPTEAPTADPLPEYVFNPADFADVMPEDKTAIPTEAPTADPLPEYVFNPADFADVMPEDKTAIPTEAPTADPLPEYVFNPADFADVMPEDKTAIPTEAPTADPLPEYVFNPADFADVLPEDKTAIPTEAPTADSLLEYVFNPADFADVLPEDKTAIPTEAPTADSLPEYVFNPSDFADVLPEDKTAIPTEAPTAEPLPEYVFTPEDFADVMPEDKTAIPTEAPTAEPLPEEETVVSDTAPTTEPLSGTLQSLIAGKETKTSEVSVQSVSAVMAVPVSSSTPQFKEQAATPALPNTGELDGIVPLIGAFLFNTGLVGMARTKQRED